jgi:RNA polymerase sigma factor (sigma-70 family)
LLRVQKPQRAVVPRSEEDAAVLEQNALDVAPAPEEKKQMKPASEPARSKTKAAASHADDAEALYREHRTLLLFIATHKFRVPDCDSENLIHDVFVSYLQQNGKQIDNVRGWLVAAMCNASRHYWRAQGKTESLPDDMGERVDPTSHGLAEQFALQMTVHQALRYLNDRCKETLHLHYFEGRSAVDVAQVLETTSRYAEKLIHNCLKRAREIYTRITAVTR